MSLIKFSTRPTPPWFGDIDRWFDAAFAPACQPAREPAPGPVTRRFVPTVDIVEDEKKIVLKADLPGVNQKDIEVKLDDGTLTLSGERRFEKETKDENLQRVECGYGSFRRSFALPETVDAEKISASYKKSVLEITLPKVKAKEKKVKVVTVH